MSTTKHRANRDESCTYCGWPFDEGDTVYANNGDDIVYCTRACIARDLPSNRAPVILLGQGDYVREWPE